MTTITGTGATALPAPRGGGIWYAGFGHHLLDAPATMADLVCAFNLDDASGSLLDSWRRRYAEVSGVLVYGGAGKHGNAVDFAGGSASLPYTRIGPDFTISLWVWRDTGESAGALWSLFRTDAIKFGANINNSNRARIYTDVKQALSGNVVAADTWTHVVVRRAGNVVSIWLDGVKEIEETAYQWAEDFEPATDFTLGGEAAGAIPSAGHHLDAVYLWNRALTDAQIAALYNGGDGRFLGENMSGEAGPELPMPTGDGLAYFIPAGLDHAGYGRADGLLPAADGAAMRTVTGTGEVTLPTCYGRGSELAYAFPDMTIEGYQAYLRRALKLEDLSSPVLDQVTYEVLPVSGTVNYRQSGIYGYSIRCNGGWITKAGESLGDNFSIACWFKYTDQTAGPLIQCRTNADNYINLQLTQQGLLAQGQAGPGVSVSAEYATSLTGDWHQVVIRRQIIGANKELTVWLDGAEVINSTDSGWGADLSTYTLELCGDLGPVLTLDEVYVWEEALSDAALVDLYRAGGGTFYVPTSHRPVGAVTLPRPTASGRGVWPVHGQGTVTLPTVIGAGAGWGHSAVGEVTLPVPTVAAVSVNGVLGTAAITLPMVAPDGMGAAGRAGTSAVTLLAPTADGMAALYEAQTGVGAVTLLAPTADGVAELHEAQTGSGAVTLLAPTADGVAELDEALTGAGAVTLPAPTADGVAELHEAQTGAGAVTLLAPTADGVARLLDAWTGIGVVTLLVPTADGASARQVNAVGTPDAPKPTVDAVGARIKTGSGAARLPMATADGNARFVLTGTGAAEAPLPTMTSAAVQSLDAAGDPEAPIPTVSVVTLRGVTGTGAVTMPLAEGYGQTVADVDAEYQIYRVVGIQHVPGQAYKYVFLEATRRPLDL